ncbi:biotin/lipoyl-binding protein [Lichenibacterium ramalinae]|uniref:HlyD family secretion protein n=1 Tax=Lichenibacterium ramalinae TaxID=2316527 RepID=A0A4Q2REY7_9HYPH|nr:HlyD family secretion protein [Lichenibacterium ramalinae]
MLDVARLKGRARPDDGGEARQQAGRDVDARAAPAPAPSHPSKAEPPAEPAPPQRRPGMLSRLSTKALKLLATVLIFAAAAVAALLIWDYYVTAPWTRDGRVRVQVASVAPQVSGQVTEIRIVDNQFVHKGDVLYVIDPFDFESALAMAKSTVRQRAADLQVKRVQADRRQHLSDLATTPEEQQQYVGNATQAQGAFEAAQAQEAQAEVNLKRTEVMSPVNGFVTNLLMRVGDYAREGSSNVSVIDADSYWVDGYFEETKMAHVGVGDAAQAQLMGYAQPLLGHVQSVTRGISVSDAAPSTQGLPNVDAVYSWVRLAQRVPVRMRIEQVPPGVPLVSGMTATVSIRDAVPDDGGPWWRRKADGVGTALKDLFDRPVPRANCVPAIGDLEGRTTTLPTPIPTAARRPDQINPGIAPGMTLSPHPR